MAEMSFGFLDPSSSAERIPEGLSAFKQSGIQTGKLKEMTSGALELKGTSVRHHSLLSSLLLPQSWKRGALALYLYARLEPI